jgi:lysophospholipase L1-like esterase
VKTKDGSQWTVSYHEHDYELRVSDYLRHMREAVEIAHSHRIRMLVALQPALFEREGRTAMEMELLRGALLPHESEAALRQSYASLRDGLRQLSNVEGCEFVDCSRIMNREHATTFTDMWHFSDVGHRLLAETLLPVIARMLMPRKDERAAP